MPDKRAATQKQQEKRVRLAQKRVDHTKAIVKLEGEIAALQEQVRVKQAELTVLRQQHQVEIARLEKAP